MGHTSVAWPYITDNQGTTSHLCIGALIENIGRGSVAGRRPGASVGCSFHALLGIPGLSHPPWPPPLSSVTPSQTTAVHLLHPPTCSSCMDCASLPTLQGLADSYCHHKAVLYGSSPGGNSHSPFLSLYCVSTTVLKLRASLFCWTFTLPYLTFHITIAHFSCDQHMFTKSSCWAILTSSLFLPVLWST